MPEQTALDFDRAKTLTEALRALGYGHRPATIEELRGTVSAGRRTVFRLATGELASVMDVVEGWEFVRQHEGS